jgi:CMP-N-acetylneuraminic acid synthetase
MGKRCVVNDHYLYNFMTTGPRTEYICQINSTSPLLKPETIKAFVNTLLDGKHDSLFATQEIRAESYFDKKPISFSRNYKKPSNELAPISTICWAIAGWRREAFIEAYDRNDPNEDGPVFVGNLGLFPIDEIEALDIDEWSTLDVVQQFLVQRRCKIARTWNYLDGRTVTI